MSRSQLTSTVEQNTGGAVSPYVAGKNAVINGGMDIWQRGTSVSIAASTAYTSAYNADRWTMPTNANQACTISRQTTSDTTNLPFIQYCARIQRNSGQTGTGQLNWGQPLETSASIPLSGKTVVVSFYARSGANYSATSNALGVTLLSGTGTDQTAWSGYTGSSTVISQTATLTTTWQRFTYSATVPVTSTELSLYYSFTPVGTAGANDYYEVTGVQLEFGSVATPFSRAGGTLSGELAACQRYFQKLSVTTSQSGELLGFGTAFSSTSVPITISVPVTMRILPSLTVSGGADFRLYDGGSAPATSGMTIYSGNTGQAITINAASSGLTQYRPYYLIPANLVAAYIQLSAEL